MRCRWRIEDCVDYRSGQGSRKTESKLDGATFLAETRSTSVRVSRSDKGAVGTADEDKSVKVAI